MYEIFINHESVGPDEIGRRAVNEDLPDWERQIYRFIQNWFDDSEQIFQHTSGSTGEPGLIGLKKSAMTVSVKNTLSFFGLKPGNTAWLCLPIDYVAGKMMVVRALLGRLNLLISEPMGCPLNPGAVVDFAAMVPLQVKNRIEKKISFEPIRRLIIGGAAVDRSLTETLNTLPTEIYASYGMTETCSHIALQRLNGITGQSGFRTLPGVTVAANDKNQLIIEAPGLLEHPLETTDLVELISNHEFRWLGRTDFIINSGGIKISPESLEQEITGIIGYECLLVPVVDEKLGQKLILAVEAGHNLMAPDLQELLIRLKQKLHPHRMPKSIVLIDRFDRKPNYKIDRRLTMQKVIRLLNEE